MILREYASRAEYTIGRTAASWRRVVTASSMAARACSRRPSLDSQLLKLSRLSYMVLVIPLAEALRATGQMKGPFI
jgi:hypothetical protein